MASPRSGAGAVRARAWVDFGKGIAISLVVLYHVTLFLGDVGIVGLPNRLKIILALFPMPAFILIAALYNSRANSWTFKALWHRRLWPLVYLYIVWSTLRFLFHLAIPGLRGRTGELPAHELKSLLAIFIWPSSSYWFIYALVLHTLFAWLLRRLPPIIHLTMAAALSMAFTSGLVDSGNVGWNRIAELYVFYVAGIVFGRSLFALFDGRGGLRIAISSVGFLALVGMLAVLPSAVSRFLILPAQAATVLVVLLVASPLAQVRLLRFVSRWGAGSLQIYLLHLFVIGLAAALLGRFLPDGVPRGVGVCIQLTLTVATILLSRLLAKLTSRYRWLYVPRPLRPGRRTARSRGNAGANSPDRR